MHRAVVNKSKERFSIVALCNPNPSIAIGPAKELIKHECPPQYKTVTLEEYFQCFYNSPLGEYMENLKL